MQVLLTNDDGIGAEGLHALRRALAELDGIEPHVIAPDSNRSATARSITTRSPLWVEEVDVRRRRDRLRHRRHAGRLRPLRRPRAWSGERPDLIVSGINHGSNLGDDITYSGTVAAALEGSSSGSRRSRSRSSRRAREMGFRSAAASTSPSRRALGAQLVARCAEPLPPGRC